MRGQQMIRWWALLQALERTRRGLTIDEILALDIGCSRRTIYRDIQQIQAMAPIAIEDGRYRLDGPVEGAWSVPVDPTMVLALVLSQDVLEPLKGTALAEPLAELRARLLPKLTPDARQFAEELRQTLFGSTFAPTDYGSRAEVVRAIQEALYHQSCLQITYTKPDEPPEDRVVEPYFSWVDSGRLYLVGFDRKREDIRTFAAQRIEAAAVLDETFERDPGFDPAAFIRRGFGVYHGPVYQITLEFAPEVAHLPRERRYHWTQKLKPKPDGSLRLSMEAAGLPEIAAWVASFGGRVRPIAPVELVDKVRELHERGLASLTRGAVTARVASSDDTTPR